MKTSAPFTSASGCFDRSTGGRANGPTTGKRRATQKEALALAELEP